MKFHNKCINKFRLLLTSTTVAIAIGLFAMEKLAHKVLTTESNGSGIYRPAYNGSDNAIFTAFSPLFDKEKTHSLVYRLNPKELSSNGTIDTGIRGFTTLSGEEKYLFSINNYLENSLSSFVTRSGKEINAVRVSNISRLQNIIRISGMALDKRCYRLYVTGIVQKGVIWIINSKMQQQPGNIDNVKNIRQFLRWMKRKGGFQC